MIVFVIRALFFADIKVSFRAMDKIVDIFKNNAELIRLFKKNGILFAYLFGSQISGYSDKNSDVDIAVMLPFEIKKEDRFDLRLKLMGEISKILKKETDVVILNDTRSLFFKYIIMKEGKIIYQENEVIVADFESKTLGMYFDFRPFLENYNKAYVKRNT